MALPLYSLMDEAIKTPLLDFFFILHNGLLEATRQAKVIG
jgi:hypothetical protein